MEDVGVKKKQKKKKDVDGGKRTSFFLKNCEKEETFMEDWIFGEEGEKSVQVNKIILFCVFATSKKRREKRRTKKGTSDFF